MDWCARRVCFICTILLLTVLLGGRPSLGSRPEDTSEDPIQTSEDLSPHALDDENKTGVETERESEACSASRDALLSKGLACNLDTWSSRVLIFATSLDCSMERVNAMLRLVASELKKQDMWAHHNARPAAEGLAVTMQPKGSPPSPPGDADVELSTFNQCARSPFRFKEIHGRYLKYFSLPIQISASELPSQTIYSRSMAFLKNTVDGEQADAQWISRLRASFNVGKVCSQFSLNLANPFVSYPLEPQNVTAEDPCTSAQVPNVFPFEKSMLGNLQNDQTGPNDFPVFWRSPAMDPLKDNILFSDVMATAYTYQGTPVGFVRTALAATDFAIELNKNVEALSRGAYFFVVDEKGSLVMSSQSARDELFWTGMTEQELMNKSGNNTCDDLRFGCERGNNSHYILSDAATLGSGMNFTGALDAAHGHVKPCNMELQAMVIESPKCNCSHAVRYCFFSANPKWTLFVGLPVASLEGVAKVNMSTVLLKEHVTSSFWSRGRDVIIEKDLYIINTGQVHFPFLAAISIPETNARVEPNAGVVQAGQQLRLKIVLATGKLQAVHSTGYIIVRPDHLASLSSCFDPLPVVHVDIIKYKFYGEAVLEAFDEHQFELGVLAMLMVILIAVLLSRSVIRDRVNSWIKENAQLDTALESLSTLPFPMVLLKLPGFRKLGKFVPHEELLNQSALTWLHTHESIEEFISTGKFIIFMSHQWTSFTEPDHTGKQYEAMLLAIDQICKDFGRGDDDTYLWLDYASIPQQHRGLQTLAINSLTVYAANVSAFVIVAPSVAHADLEDEFCNKETYSRRAWCRAEQLSHLLAKSDASMYLAEGNSLHRLTPEWLEQSAHVFDGELTCCRRKHVGMECCDKERLVIPMLGLYAQYCARVQGQPAMCSLAAKEVERKLQLLEKEAQLFPESFEFKLDEKSEQRVLFGNLLARMKEREAHSDSKMSH